MSKKVVLITGASGPVGRATIKALGKYADTLDVRAGVRDPVKSAHLAQLAPNVTVVAADPKNEPQMVEACKGIDYLYLIPPPDSQRLYLTLDITVAARDAGVKLIFLLSVFTARLIDTVFGKQYYNMEQHVRYLGPPFVIIRTPLFLDNLHSQIESIKTLGTFYDAIEPDTPYSTVAVEDVAEVAAKILSNPEPHLSKWYKLAAPSDTNANVAKYLSEALGKPVSYTKVGYEDVKLTLLGRGMEDWKATGIVELEKLINSGAPVLNDPEGARDAEEVLGRPPTSVKAWVESAAHTFK